MAKKKSNGGIEISGYIATNIQEVILEAYTRAFTKTIELVYSRAVEFAPVGKGKTGPVLLRNAIRYEVDPKKGIGFVGFPDGSESDRIALWVELGTGERGSSKFTPIIEGTIKPQFTIPIVPLHADALHWVTPEGKHIFAKQTRGQSPQPFLRRAYVESKREIEAIWKNEFSSTRLQPRMKFKNL